MTSDLRVTIQDFILGLTTIMPLNVAMDSFFCNYDTSNITSRLLNEDLIEHITKDLKDHIKLSKTDRLYIIWRDSETKKVKGEFISGARKQSPWEGYAKLSNQKTIDTAD